MKRKPKYMKLPAWTGRQARARFERANGRQSQPDQTSGGAASARSWPRYVEIDGRVVDIDAPIDWDGWALHKEISHE